MYHKAWGRRLGRKRVYVLYLQLGKHQHWDIDRCKHIAGVVDDNEEWGKEEENSVRKPPERPSEEVEGGEEQCRDSRRHPVRICVQLL